MPSSKSHKKGHQGDSHSASRGQSVRPVPGGVTGAVIPPMKKKDQFPLMSFVAKNCTFADEDEGSCFENEDVLKAANDRKVNELLEQAAFIEQDKECTSDEAERKKALEMIYSLEYARNQEDTWKVPQPVPKKGPDYGGFLHPLSKKNEKDEAYFSGTRKVKPAKERKRSRSDDVVLLDNGKLIPKSGTNQLPIEITLPPRANAYRPRVPSLGLPFTPGSPPVDAFNAWTAGKSGSELFSDVQTSTLVAHGVTGDEEHNLALAIAESIRTAKLEQERTCNFKEKYTINPNPAAAAARECEEPYKFVLAEPLGTTWDDEPSRSSNQVVQPQGRNGSSKKSGGILEANNNSWDRIESNCFNSSVRAKCKEASNPEVPVDRNSQYALDAVSHGDKSSTNKISAVETEVKVPKSREVTTHDSKQIGPHKEKGLSLDDFSSAGDRMTGGQRYLSEALLPPGCRALEKHQPMEKVQGKKTANELPEDDFDFVKSSVKEECREVLARRSRKTISAGLNPEGVDKDQDDQDTSREVRSPRPRKDLSSDPNLKDLKRVQDTSPVVQSPRPRRDMPTGLSPKDTVKCFDTDPNCRNEASFIPPSITNKPKPPTSKPALVGATRSIATDCMSSIQTTLENKNVAQQDRPACIDADVNCSFQGDFKDLSVKVPQSVQAIGGDQPKLPEQMLAKPLDFSSMAALPLETQILLLQQAMCDMMPAQQGGQNLGNVNSQHSSKQPEGKEKDREGMESYLTPGPLSAGGLPGLIEGVFPMPNNLQGLSSGLPGMQPTGHVIPNTLPELPHNSPSCFPEIPNSMRGVLPGFPNGFSGPLNIPPRNPPVPPNNLSGGLSELTNSASGGKYGLPNNVPGGMYGLPNNVPGGLYGLPNDIPGGMYGLPNSAFGGVLGVSNNLPGGLLGMPNNLPGAMMGMPGVFPGLISGVSGLSNILPGMPNNLSGGTLGGSNMLHGSLSGLSNNFPGGVPGHANQFPPNASGIQDPLGSGILNPLNLPNSLPGANVASASAPGLLNCGSFAGSGGSLPQPGSTSQLIGKGRGRLARSRPV